MTAQDYESYYTVLESNFETHTTHAVQNSDGAHNATIMKFMLDHAQVINIYCGQLSIFRNFFYDNLDQSDGNNKIGTFLKDKIIQSLKNFLIKENTELKIIVRDFKNSYFDELISKDYFLNGITQGKIKLKKINDKLISADSITHFSFTDNNIVRMEQDLEERSGLCAVYIPREMQTTLENNFKNILMASDTIEV